MKHIVHCSGYSLAEVAAGSMARDWQGRSLSGRFFDWEFVCIGTVSLLGRIPMAIRVADLFNAETLVWSTGATYVDSGSEAEIMLQVALDRVCKRSQVAWLKRISLVETESKNTRTSIKAIRKMIAERVGNEPLTIHFVTSANHAPRVARDAAIEFSEHPNIILSVVPAHTSYGGKQPSDVSILELPERQ
jgi:hypothetical protein